MWELLIGWILLLVMSMPITFSILLVCIIYLFLNGGMLVAVQRIVMGVNSFTLLAIPLFIFAANIMNATGVTERLFRFAKVLVGHITGGLGQVNILASLLFSGMSGSAHADAGGLGKIEIQAMREEGYDDGFTGAITAASSVVGPIMPPSIPMVIYAAIANVSVGKLFIGGIIPAILCSFSLMIIVFIIARKKGYKVHPKANLKEGITAFIKAFPALLTPIIIIGGIFSGFFTPTEAAAIASLYALIIGTLVYKSLTLKKLREIIRDTLSDSAMIGFIVAAISVMGYVLAMEQVPQKISTFFITYTSNPIVFLLVVNLLLLLLGTVMETMAILLLIVPTLVPIAIALGIDPIHFGVVVVLNMMIGILSPPMGVSLFVVAKVGDIPFSLLAKSILPFIIPLFVILLMVTFSPWLVMFLPNLMH